MLSAAEESLVRRDPALPGLRCVLDAQELSAWVSDLMGRPVTVRRRHLRYKPGTSAVLHVEAGGVPLLVSAHAPHGQVKHEKTRTRARSAIWGMDRRRGLLVGAPAADRDLPALRLLADPHRRRRLVTRLLGSTAVLALDEEPRLLRYKPHRRWVGTLPAVGGGHLLLRVHPPHVAHRSATALAALQHAEPATPALLGHHERYGILAAEFLPGRPATQEPVFALTQAGVALASLHRRKHVRLPARDPRQDSHVTSSTAHQLGVLLPELAPRSAAAAERIGARLEELPGRSMPIHGDFSADQVVIGPRGDVALIDLDSAGLGDPASDLGCAIAALTQDSVLHDLSPEAHRRRVDSLLNGYTRAGGPAEPHRVRLHTGAHLLRRTVEPFRLGLSDDWPRVADLLLGRAEAALDDLEAVR